MNILKERQKFLSEELAEYESVTPMTDEEREILHEWVNKGHSVHENWSLACREGGAPMDFLDVYREEMDEQALLSAMSVEERARYLYEEYGYPLNGSTMQTLEELMKEDSPWAGL